MTKLTKGLSQILDSTMIKFEVNHVLYLQQGVTPGAGLLAWAGLGIKLWIFQVELILEGKILDTTFPFKCEIGFSKFPLDLKYV